VRTACPEQCEGAGVEPKANGSTRRVQECERRELNPHPLRDRILSPARLPVSPRSRGRNITVNCLTELLLHPPAVAPLHATAFQLSSRHIRPEDDRLADIAVLKIRGVNGETDHFMQMHPPIRSYSAPRTAWQPSSICPANLWAVPRNYAIPQICLSHYLTNRSM
jgi:hypothetical protein